MLLLRMLVVLLVMVQTIAYVVATPLSVIGWAVAALVLASAVCLLLGFLTPIVVGLIGATVLVLAFATTPYSIQDLELAVLAVVIALLGPGAFSIDARMFGRREILIPTHRSNTRDLHSTERGSAES